MRKKISISMWLMAMLTLAVTLAIVVSSLYSHYTEEQFGQLRNETRLATEGVNFNGVDFLEQLGDVDFRVTWITADGVILFDNEANLAAMENHLEREEIRDALSTGYGESSRYSATLYERQLYTAQRLGDGTILRLSITQATVWNLVRRFLFPILGAALAALLLSVLIAWGVSSRIVRPINSIDLDDPMSDSGEQVYAEIRPLLSRLDAQHRQIRKDREELEKTSRIRQEFTANASHELKTPLHIISGYAELLENGLVKEEDARKFAGQIRSESQRMTSLVEDILDLTSLDGGSVGVEHERTDLFRIAQNAVDSLEHTADETDVSLTLEGERAEIMGIPKVLYSLVYNLCINAVKYSFPGGAVDVRVRREGDSVVLSVKDEGVGIPPEDQERIFERFYRVDKSRSKEVGGTGLGLSIVKHAVLTHGASIRVESEPGKGSLFTVTFPAAP